MSKFKTEYDAKTGQTLDWYWDQQDKKLSCNRKQDVSSVLEMCKASRNAESSWRKFGKEQTMHKVGSIPNIVIDEIMKKYGINPFEGDEEVSKRFYKIIKEEYPLLLSTNAKGVL